MVYSIGDKVYRVCSNDDPRMTFDLFMAQSNLCLVAVAILAFGFLFFFLQENVYCWRYAKKNLLVYADREGSDLSAQSDQSFQSANRIIG